MNGFYLSRLQWCCYMTLRPKKEAVQPQNAQKWRTTSFPSLLCTSYLGLHFYSILCAFALMGPYGWICVWRRWLLYFVPRNKSFNGISNGFLFLNFNPQTSGFYKIIKFCTAKLVTRSQHCYKFLVPTFLSTAKHPIFPWKRPVLITLIWNFKVFFLEGIDWL